MAPRIGAFTQIAQNHSGNSNSYVKATDGKGLYVGKKFSMAGLVGGKDRLAKRAATKAAGFNRIETALAQQYGTLFAKNTMRRLGLTAETGVTQKDIGQIQSQAAAFEKFVDAEFSSENTSFLRNVNDMVRSYGVRDQHHQLKTDEAGRATHLDWRSVPAFKKDMKTLYNSHIKTHSEFEVNLSASERKTITRSMAEIDTISDDDVQKLFQDLQNAGRSIGTLMGDSAFRFESKQESNAQQQYNQVMDNLKSIGLV